MKIKVGCCGWGFFRPSYFFGDSWRKNFKSVLQAYSKLFDVVAVNSTFYKLPKVETATRWLQQSKEVNPKFEFTFKINKSITHELKFGEGSLQEFEKNVQVAKALEAKVLVFQTPKSFKATDENFQRVERFFSKVKNLGFTIVWEPRGSWLDEKDRLRKLLKKVDVSHCVDIFRNEPVYLSSQKILYVRLHGLGKKMYDYDYSNEELKELLDKILSYEGKANVTYVMFNNYNMYTDALDFVKLLNKKKN